MDLTLNNLEVLSNTLSDLVKIKKKKENWKIPQVFSWNLKCCRIVKKICQYDNHNNNNNEL